MRLLLILLLTLNLLHAQKIALLIGNSDYSFQPLSNPLNDVDGIYKTLIEIGFKESNIKVLKNKSQNEMKRSLFNFEQKASKSEIALIYFSGHGMQVNNTNYLFPANTTATKPIHLEGLVNLNFFIQSASSAKYGVILVDACRNNPLVKYFQNGKHKGSYAKKGLGQVTPTAGQVVIGFATSAGDTADDGGGKMSPYALALTNRLKGRDDIRNVLGKVAEDVSSSHEQNPIYRANLASSVCLTGSCTENTVDNSKELQGLKVELEKLKNKTDMEELQRLKFKLAKLKNKTVRDEIEKLKLQLEKLKNKTDRDELEKSKAKLPIHNPIPDKIKYSLSIYPKPADARVEIMGIQSHYYDGIRLKAQEYNIKVSKDGYGTKNFWITLNKNIRQYVPLKKNVFPKKIQNSEYFLTINTIPSDARVQITNIKPRYRDGIQLKEGSYAIKVQAKGYQTKRKNIFLKSDTSDKIILEKNIVKRENLSIIQNKQKNVSLKNNKRILKRNSKNIVKRGNLMYQNQPFTKKYNWNGVRRYCRGLTLGRYSDWRLPREVELKKLINNRKLRREFVKNLPRASVFWTSDENDDSFAWAIDFRNGRSFWELKSYSYYVLCVR